jgi:hypothetical protein
MKQHDKRWSAPRGNRGSATEQTNECAFLQETQRNSRLWGGEAAISHASSIRGDCRPRDWCQLDVSISTSDLDARSPANIESCLYTHTLDHTAIMDRFDEGIVIGCGYSGIWLQAQHRVGSHLSEPRIIAQGRDIISCGCAQCCSACAAARERVVYLHAPGCP